MKLVKVTRTNEADTNPWIPSEFPFEVLREWEHAGEKVLVITPFGSDEDRAHYIPESHTAPFVFPKKKWRDYDEQLHASTNKRPFDV